RHRTQSQLLHPGAAARPLGGRRSRRVPEAGAILVNRQQVPLLKAHLWVHRNRPGTADLLPAPFRLPVPEGISVYPTGTPGAPRLPLLGPRGPVRNRLRLVIDGTEVSLAEKPRKPDR